jgi:hypothetical protein
MSFLWKGHSPSWFHFVFPGEKVAEIDEKKMGVEKQYLYARRVSVAYITHSVSFFEST